MFELNEEQRLIQKSTYEFAKKELAPKASYWDTHEEFPWESVKKMAAIGLPGLRLPASYGGSGADLISTGIVFEQVARFDHSCAIILCGCNITGRILLHASPSIKDACLPEIVKGRSIIAFAAMESEAGSDIRAARTTAKRQNEKYVVNGEKSMITFAQVAQGFVVLVRTDPETRGPMSCIFIEANRPGIDIQKLEGFGWRATKWGNVAFDEVKVPADHLIGEKDKALTMLKPTVQEQRALTGLIALGTAKQALEEAIHYAKIRNVFGKPLGKFEGIQFRLADHYTLLEASRLVCYNTLHLIEKKSDEATVWAAMANLIGGETAYRVVETAMDVYGGIGYSKDLPIERYLRDVKAVQIANATLKMEIGRGLLGKEFLPYA
jgi:cyclohexanecarboxyl-CoA dehydrogenase